MNKIFNDAKDKNVAAVLVYPDADGYACSDEDATIKMSAAELKDAFFKGMIVVDTDSWMIPVAMSEVESYVAVAVGEDTLYSKEYTAD